MSARPLYLTRAELVVSARLDLPLEALRSRSRRRPIARAKAALALALRYRGHSFGLISRDLGIHHTTAIHRCTVAQSDPQLAAVAREAALAFGSQSPPRK